jgi:alanyl-tRNA synthetase
MKGKLYYENPYLTTFTATILEKGKEPDGTPYLILDQTAFYPTGGGQPCDLGMLDQMEVIDVEEIDGRIHHRLRDSKAFNSFQVGETIQGTIDWERRFDHMQQHTGQHILSAAFEDRFNAPTVGFHMGHEIVTIDVVMPNLNQDIIHQVEELANQIVFENRTITARFVSPEELVDIPLRKPPTVTENIRIVTIMDYDHNPCGGTHPYRTGEVGPIKVIGWEKTRGNIRIAFVCGMRAIRTMTEKQMILKDICRILTCGEKELPVNVERILQERKEMEQSLHTARMKLLDTEANDLLGNANSKQGVKLITSILPDRNMQELQKLAQIIIAKEQHSIVLLLAPGIKLQAVFARGEAVSADMNALLKDTLQRIEGKGGGSPKIAQGGGQSDVPAQEILDFAITLLEDRYLKGKT